VNKSKFTVRLLRAAENDLAEILEYIAADNPRAAEETLAHIEKDLQLLAQQPNLGRIPSNEDLLRMGFRFLVVLDSLIFYTLEEKTLLVHRIIHGARDFTRLW
jgi:toxin ParE1/3/4